MLDRTRFRAAFAAEVSAERAAFLADSQLPWGVGALGGTTREASWRKKPNWYMLTTEGQDDPAAGAAVHGQAGRGDGRPGRARCPSAPDAAAIFRRRKPCRM
jgi:hypothetical protein